MQSRLDLQKGEKNYSAIYGENPVVASRDDEIGGQKWSEVVSRVWGCAETPKRVVISGQEWSCFLRGPEMNDVPKAFAKSGQEVVIAVR